MEEDGDRSVCGVGGGVDLLDLTRDKFTVRVGRTRRARFGVSPSSSVIINEITSRIIKSNAG